MVEKKIEQGVDGRWGESAEGSEVDINAATIEFEEYALPRCTTTTYLFSNF